MVLLSKMNTQCTVRLGCMHTKLAPVLCFRIKRKGLLVNAPPFLSLTIVKYLQHSFKRHFNLTKATFYFMTGNDQIIIHSLSYAYCP